MADNDKVEAQEETPVGDEADSVEGEDASEESEQSSDDESDESSDKASNWKAMSKALKAARKEIAALKKGKDADNGEDDPVSVDKSDLALFLVENPDAKEYKAAVLKAMKEYGGISLDKAWKFVKATAPKPSETKRDLSVKFTAVNPPKDISKLSEDEALKLSNSQYLKWARATGKIK